MMYHLYQQNLLLQAHVVLYHFQTILCLYHLLLHPCLWYAPRADDSFDVELICLVNLIGKFHFLKVTMPPKSPSTITCKPLSKKSRLNKMTFVLHLFCLAWMINIFSDYIRSILRTCSLVIKAEAFTIMLSRFVVAHPLLYHFGCYCCIARFWWQAVSSDTLINSLPGTISKHHRITFYGALTIRVLDIIAGTFSSIEVYYLNDYQRIGGTAWTTSVINICYCPHEMRSSAIFKRHARKLQNFSTARIPFEK